MGKLLELLLLEELIDFYRERNLYYEPPEEAKWHQADIENALFIFELNF